MREEWLTDKHTGEHLYTVYRKTDPVPDLPLSYWDGKGVKDKKRFAVWVLGTTEGRNLISRALEFYIRYGDTGVKRREIAEVLRKTLFDCHVEDDTPIRVDAVIDKLEIVSKERKK